MHRDSTSKIVPVQVKVYHVNVGAQKGGWHGAR
jgi:hypothetical protein